MSDLALTDSGALTTATIEGARWLSHIQLWRPAAQPELRIGEVETAAVILRGTFDLLAGQPDGTMNSWPARGARTTPFAGRPMAVYLPPASRFSAVGDGEILLVGARQPAQQDPVEGREALGQSPLLPLAGSGKSFDPNTGEWLPAEAFPNSPESLPPRRMQRRTFADVAVERVFPTDYKAATLTIDELVLQPGEQLAVTAIDDRPPHDELALFVRDGRGDRARFISTPGGATDLVLRAETGPLYALLAYAGK